LELPCIEGLLKKKSPNFLQGWQPRHCAIRNKKFLYYEEKNLEKVVGCLDFELLSVKIEEPSDREFKISPYGSKKVFLFKTKDKNEQKKWVSILKQHVQVSEGALRFITTNSSIPRFWKNDRISETQFLQMADSGDILLFRAKNVGAKLQRSFTGSIYDHVAILLRYNDGEIVLLEATGKDGVGLCRWKTFMRNDWHLLYSKLVYRHLEVERTEEFISEVEKFVKNVVGKKYKISASKLFKKKSALVDAASEADQLNTFFCSELVAACYKKLRLLPQELSCATYWPGNFSCEKKLPLLKDTKLSQEQLIDFRLP